MEQKCLYLVTHIYRQELQRSWLEKTKQKTRYWNSMLGSLCTHYKTSSTDVACYFQLFSFFLFWNLEQQRHTTIWIKKIRTSLTLYCNKCFITMNTKTANIFVCRPNCRIHQNERMSSIGLLYCLISTFYLYCWTKLSNMIWKFCACFKSCQ